MDDLDLDLDDLLRDVPSPTQEQNEAFLRSLETTAANDGNNYNSSYGNDASQFETPDDRHTPALSTTSDYFSTVSSYQSSSSSTDVPDHHHQDDRSSAYSTWSASAESSSSLCTSVEIDPNAVQVIPPPPPARQIEKTTVETGPTKRKWKRPKKNMLVLRFNPGSFVDFLSSGGKKTTNDDYRDQTDDLSDQSTSSSTIDRQTPTPAATRTRRSPKTSWKQFDQSVQRAMSPSLETVNVRLYKENEKLRNEIAIIDSRNDGMRDEIEELRNRLMQESELAPIVGRNPSDVEDPLLVTNFGSSMMQIPIAAIVQRQSDDDQRANRISTTKRKESTNDVISSKTTTPTDHDYDACYLPDDRPGICLHVVDDSVCIELCEECDESAKKRARAELNDRDASSGE